MIKLGAHYQDRYHLDNPPEQWQVQKKPYGYWIRRVTNYVCIYTTRLEIYPDGAAKAKCKIERNYCPVEYVTYYFDCSGREIISNNNSTRAELAYFKKERTKDND